MPLHIQKPNSTCRGWPNLRPGPSGSGGSAIGAHWTGEFLGFIGCLNAGAEEKNVCLYRKCDPNASVLCQ
jgi:hypothetical protein